MNTYKPTNKSLEAYAAIQRLATTLNRTPTQLAKDCGFESVYEYQKWLTDEISQPGGSDEDDTNKMSKAFSH